MVLEYKKCLSKCTSNQKSEKHLSEVVECFKETIFHRVLS